MSYAPFMGDNKPLRMPQGQVTDMLMLMVGHKGV